MTLATKYRHKELASFCRDSGSGFHLQAKAGKTKSPSRFFRGDH